MSKIYERHTHDSLYAHLSRNDLLYGLQSGFRKRHSTETALIRLLDQILFDIDSNNVTGLVCVDDSKAFDLINHDILLVKLNAYGVDDGNSCFGATWPIDSSMLTSMGTRHPHSVSPMFSFKEVFWAPAVPDFHQ